MRLTWNRMIALAALAAAGLMAGCSADSPGPTGIKPSGGGGNSTLQLTLTPSTTTPVQGNCVLVTANATQNGAPVPNGTSILLSASFGSFAQNGLQTISLVSQNGIVQTALCSDNVGPAAVNGVVTIGSNSAHASTGVVFQPNGFNKLFISVCANPHTGSVSGGDTITITGGGFGTDLTKVHVLFRSGAVVHQGIVTGLTDNQITVTTPAFPELANLPATPVEVDVVVNGQTLASPGCFTYTTAGQPIITAILPSSGTKVGGTRVTITGSGFAAPLQVFFGGTLEAQVVSVTPTQIIALTPPANGEGPAQSFPENVDVTVKEGNCSGNSCTSGPVTFTYTVGLSIFGFTPDHGDSTTTVTITGEGFVAPLIVSFGGTQGSVLSVSGTQILAKPAAGCGSSGPITVTLLATGESVSSSTNFTQGGPTVTAGPSPNTGLANVTTTVTVQGTNLFSPGTPTSVQVVNVSGGSATIASVSQIGSTQTVAVNLTPTCTGSSMTFALQNTVTGCTTSALSFAVTNSTAVTGQTPTTPLPIGVPTSATITGTGLFPPGNFSGAVISGVSGGTVTITGGTDNGTSQTLNLSITPNGNSCTSSSFVSFSVVNSQTHCSSGQVSFAAAGTGITASAPSPASGPTNVATSVTVTGTGLFPSGNSTAVQVVNVTGGTVTITGASEASGQQTVTLSITPSASGCNSQTVTFALRNTVGGCTSQTLTFTGTGGAPAVTSGPTPSSGPSGSTTAVTVSGTNFFPTGNPGAVSITNISGGTVSVTGTSENSGTQTLNLNITPTSACGAAAVTFTIHNSVTGCTSGTVSFNSTGGSPTVTSGPSPSSGPSGTTTAVTVSGTNLFPTGNPGAAQVVNVSGSGTVVIAGSTDGPTQTLTLNITPTGCAAGTISFQIKNSATGCTSSTLSFNSTGGGLVIESGPTPSSGPATSTTTGVTITGTGFFPAGNPAAATLVGVGGGSAAITSATQAGDGTQTLTISFTPSGCGVTSMPFQIQNSVTTCTSGQLSFIVTGTPAVTTGPTPSCAPNAGGDVVVKGNSFFPIGNPAQVGLTGVANGTATITGAVDLGGGQQELRIHIVPSGANPVTFTIQNLQTGCSSQALSVLVDNTPGDCPAASFP